jgi:hypothetical protein
MYCFYRPGRQMAQYSITVHIGAIFGRGRRVSARREDHKLRPYLGAAVGRQYVHGVPVARAAHRSG